MLKYKITEYFIQKKRYFLCRSNITLSNENSFLKKGANNFNTYPFIAH